LVRAQRTARSITQTFASHAGDNASEERKKVIPGIGAGPSHPASAGSGEDDEAIGQAAHCCKCEGQSGLYQVWLMRTHAPPALQLSRLPISHSHDRRRVFSDFRPTVAPKE
jgi:hypothetical protein